MSSKSLAVILLAALAASDHVEPIGTNAAESRIGAVLS